MRDNCEELRDLAIVDMLASTGMRIGEMVLLNRDDLNFNERECIVLGKGSKERIVYFDARAKLHLQEYLKSRVDDNPALFVTAKKPYNRLTKNGIEFILKNIAKKTGISRLRLYPHKYRSTFATNLLNKGADLSTISKMMGHANVDTTLNVYCDYKTDTLKRDHDKYIS
jgi:site-specific recombinase XerD